jgi:hypothetical protein
MIAALSQYLDSIRDNLRLDFSVEREVMNELESHIEDELQELKEAGLSEEEAVSTCVRLLGSAKLVARQIYEAHSQGSWRQTLLASLPHLLFGLIFVLNWWQEIGWLLVMLGLVLSTVVYGWWHGKPTWLFPWLGYSLVPVVAAGLFLLYLPEGWSWVAILIYIPLALWLVYAVTVQTIKKDWLFSSLMLLPVPIIAGWLIAVGWERRFPEFSLERLYDFAPWTGLSFLALGLSVTMFIRLRQRWLKVSVLFISGFLTLILVACYAGGRLGLPTFLFLTLIMLGVFLTPALLERKIRRGGSNQRLNLLP